MTDPLYFDLTHEEIDARFGFAPTTAPRTLARAGHDGRGEVGEGERSTHSGSNAR